MTQLAIVYALYPLISVSTQEAHFTPMLDPSFHQVLRDWRRPSQAKSGTTRRIHPELHGDALSRLPEASPVVRLQGVSTA